MRILTVVTVIISCWGLGLAQVSVDANFGIPFQIDDLNNLSLSDEPGSSWTGNLKFVRNHFGIGLQYNHSRYLPNQDLLNSVRAIPGAREQFSNAQWTTNLISIGPVIRLGKSRFYLDFFPRIGLQKINPSDRMIQIQENDQQLLLYQDNHEELSENSTFYGIDGALNIGVSERVDLQLFAGLNTRSGVGSSTIYRDTEGLGTGSTFEDVSKMRLLQHDCEGYSLITTGIGIKISFGNRKPKGKDAVMKPPIPFYPENGAVIAEEDSRALQLEWQAEEPEVSQANYRVFLYQVTSSGTDSLIHEGKTNRQLRLQLPATVALRDGITYRWQVQAVDHKQLEPCPDDCYSIFFEFEIDGMGLPAFYQLLDKNIGMAVPSGGVLRFVVNEDLLYEDQLTLTLFDERNAVVLESVNLRNDSRVTTVNRSRFEMRIDQLAQGKQYTLEVSNGKRSQYLRFYRTGPKDLRDEKL